VPAHGVQELGEDGGLESPGLLFEHSEAEMDVAEEPTLDRGLEERAPVQLPDPSDVVEERRCDQQVAAQAAMELGRVPAKRCYGHGVFQEPTRVAVVAFWRRGQGPEPRSELGVFRKATHESRQPGVGDLADQELEEAVQLLEVAPRGRRERRGVVLGRLDRTYVELEAIPKALHPTQHSHGVPLAETPVEELHVVPHAGLDPPARVDELEG